MNNNRVKNQNKTFTVPIWVLAFIQTFGIWQMGVTYYTSEAFTINGDTPIPVNVDSTVVPILLGYLVGAAVALLIPTSVGIWGRVAICISLICTISLCLPLSVDMVATLYCVSVFAGVLFISALSVLAINMYSLKTALTDGIVAALVSSPFIALMHLQGFSLSFKWFIMFTIVVQILMLIGFSRIPYTANMKFLKEHASPAPAYKAGDAKGGNGTKKEASRSGVSRPPAILLTGTVFIFTIVCFCILFSSTMAESIPNGIALYYAAGAMWTVFYALLCFKKNMHPMRLYTIFLGISAVGFGLRIIDVPALVYVSTLLQGSNICLTNLAWFIAGILFEKWNSRFIAPLSILISMGTVLIHSGILNTFRHSTDMLYAAYTGIILVLLILYLIMEPYFSTVWMGCVSRDPDSEDLSPTDVSLLTVREREVVNLAVEGYINADIAKVLYISEYTVKDHLKRAYKKLNVHSRFELATKLNKMK